MKIFIRIFFIVLVFNLIAGYIVKSNDVIIGNKWIGVTVFISFFIFMPIFLYHGWKDKKLENYSLSKENLQKMRETIEKNNFKQN
tara:strand:- start:584 stop:838 length:255 start_codon:yes stop_codon:yes gene_type:complete